MQNFVQYAEAAMKRCKITSYNKLSKELGIANSSIVRMRSGKVLPAAKTMVKLARLAGVPEEKAILDLAAWANADKPEIQKIYERISKMIGFFVVFFTLFFANSSAYAAPLPTVTLSLDSAIIYIMLH